MPRLIVLLTKLSPVRRKGTFIFHQNDFTVFIPGRERETGLARKRVRDSVRERWERVNEMERERNSERQ